VKKFSRCLFAALLVIAGHSYSSARAEVIIGGSATLSIDPTALANATTLSVDRFFGGVEAATFTRTQVLSSPDSPPASLDLPFSVNIPPIVNPTGRARRATDLDFDFAGFNPLSPLASWSNSNPAGFGIAGGEQIALDGVIRYDSPLGTLVSGDFVLRYQANRATSFGIPAFSGLVLVNLFDFPASSFDIGNAVVSVSGKTLTVDGDLLISPEFSNGFFGGLVTGFDVGNFSLTATAVPEASTMLLCSVAGALALGLRFRRVR
jgi:hypothetical protein